jgi:hypothetical protein
MNRPQIKERTTEGCQHVTRRAWKHYVIWYFLSLWQLQNIIQIHNNVMFSDDTSYEEVEQILSWMVSKLWRIEICIKIHLLGD